MSVRAHCASGIGNPVAQSTDARSDGAPEGGNCPVRVTRNRSHVSAHDPRAMTSTGIDLAANCPSLKVGTRRFGAVFQSATCRTQLPASASDRFCHFDGDQCPVPIDHHLPLSFAKNALACADPGWAISVEPDEPHGSAHIESPSPSIDEPLMCLAAIFVIFERILNDSSIQRENGSLV